MKTGLDGPVQQGIRPVFGPTHFPNRPAEELSNKPDNRIKIGKNRKTGGSSDLAS
jgi:hypothetical protein